MLTCQVTLTVKDSYDLGNSTSTNFTVRLPPSVHEQPAVWSLCMLFHCLLHTRQRCWARAVAAATGSTAGPSPKTNPDRPLLPPPVPLSGDATRPVRRHQRQLDHHHG